MRTVLLSPFVLAELDYLIAKFAGVAAEAEFLDEVATKAYRLTPFGASDVEEARQIITAHADLAVGLADASLVVLARRLQCRDLLTLDERHFRVLCPDREHAFRILPADH